MIRFMLISVVLLMGMDVSFAAETGAKRQETLTDVEIDDVDRWRRFAGPQPAQEVFDRLVKAVSVDTSNAPLDFLASSAMRAKLIPDEKHVQLDLLLAAFQKGYLPAQATYGWLKCVAEDGVVYDPKDGLALLRNALSKQSRDAFYLYGSLLGNDAFGMSKVDGLEPDHALACKDLRLAIDGGMNQAWSPLAVLQAQMGDTVTAVETVRKGTEVGDSQAKYLLGYWYLTGTYLPRNTTLAEKLLLAAAADTRETAPAAKQLGGMYFDNQQFPDHLEKSFRWYFQGATRGDQECQRKAAVMQMTGSGTTMDTEAGVASLQRLADVNDAESQTELAIIYIDGLVVPRDLEKARKLLEPAFRQNVPRAKYYLAWLNQSGNGSSRH